MTESTEELPGGDVAVDALLAGQQPEGPAGPRAAGVVEQLLLDRDGPPLVALPDDLAARVEQAIEATDAARNAGADAPSPRTGPGWWAIAAAVNALMLAGVAMMVLQMHNELVDLRAAASGLLTERDQLAEERSAFELRALKSELAVLEARKREELILTRIRDEVIKPAGEALVKARKREQQLEAIKLALQRETADLRQQLEQAPDGAALVARIEAVERELVSLDERGAAERARLRELGARPSAFGPVDRAPRVLRPALGKLQAFDKGRGKVNLGSATHPLVAGVRFAVFGEDFTGRPRYRGVVEVTLVGEQESEVRLVRADRSHPLQAGMAVHNPLLRAKLGAVGGPLKLALVGGSPTLEAVSEPLAKLLAAMQVERQAGPNGATGLVLVERGYLDDGDYIRIRQRGRTPLLHVSRLDDYLALKLPPTRPPVEALERRAERLRQRASDAEDDVSRLLELLESLGPAGKQLADKERERRRREAALVSELQGMEDRLRK